MTCTKNAVAVSTICGLLVLGLGGVGQAAESSTRKAFTISGSVGLPGVTLQGLPGNPMTDENGVYSAKVPSGWSGTVTPARLGYTYTPSSRTYSAVEEDLTKENYQASLLTFTISGKLGVAQVAMQGLPGNPVTNPDGGYEVQVPYGWSGTVTPVKEGYTFTPRARTYTHAAHGQANENYVARIRTFTISGQAGVVGVAMKGLPGNPITDAKGCYSAKVEYGWAGTVTPVKEGYVFEPTSKAYQQLVTDRPNENYAARVLTFTISGNVGAPGVAMKGLPGNPITDAKG
ncbi:MAG: hypothetical protein JW955_17165, partial [Sedimentisphaerales bacterium]|nr:hypothetical protein [Sedimentisphaerales bacterium]